MIGNQSGDEVGFPRFCRHLTWRDNAPGGGHDEEKETAVYAGVQG